jgi:IS1 family transposase
MNKLPLEKRVHILTMLVEGVSMRSISRVADVSINTVTKLLVEAGEAAEAFHDRTVNGLKTSQLQCDEIWSYCYAKQGNVAKMKALDRDSKMIVSWFAGDRTNRSAEAFLGDAAGRIVTPVQVTTDGFKGYEMAMQKTFGNHADNSYGQIKKVYAATADKGPARRYSPGVCVSADREARFGNPDEKMTSTSHVERMNLNMRMGMRRFTRLTNAFSKKLDNHLHALALYFFHYNFCRQHKSLRTSPAQAAGVTDELLTMEHLCAIMDAANPPKKRGPYKKQAA